LSVAAGQQERLAADAAAQLAEGDDRAGERDGADEDVDEDLESCSDRAAAGVTSSAQVAGEPTSTAAAPTKLCRSATSSGMAVIATRAAMTRRWPAPTTSSASTMSDA
jgi:hypothetical protein